MCVHACVYACVWVCVVYVHCVCVLFVWANLCVVCAHVYVCAKELLIFSVLTAEILLSLFLA